MKRTIIIIMFLTAVSKIIGFGREMILSYYYGASNISDAYLISLTIPTVIFSIIATGLVTSYIPVYSEVNNNGQDSNRFTNNILNFVLGISLIIILLVLIFTTPLVKLFASGFNGETLQIAVNFTKISILVVFFSGMSYIFRGYLQSNDNYFAPALIGLPYNFFIIVSILLSTKYSLSVLPIGSVIASISQILFMIPFLKNKGYSFAFIIDFRDKYLKKIIFLSLPVILGTSVNQINKLVDRTIASRISVGGISALNYSNRLNAFVFEIFVMSIATVIYPAISRMATENNIKGFKKSILEATNSINLFIIPVTIGTMIFAEPIVSLLFARGAFNDSAVYMTSNALFFYSIGMIGIGLRELLSRAFYSLQDTKKPMINAGLSMILNIILNIILSRYLGIGGLALATSISAIFCTILLYVSLRRKIGAIGLKRILVTTIKIIFASTLMALIAKFSFEKLLCFYSSNLSLIVAIIVGMVVYSTIIYFFRIKEVDLLVDGLKRKIKTYKSAK